MLLAVSCQPPPSLNPLIVLPALVVFPNLYNSIRYVWCTPSYPVLQRLLQLGPDKADLFFTLKCQRMRSYCCIYTQSNEQH